MCHSYLFISEGVQKLMIWTEEQISQDGVSVAHHHVLVQQSRLGNGVHQDLEKKERRTEQS